MDGLPAPTPIPDDWLAWRAAATPQALALVTPDEAWTYAQLHTAADAWAAYLLHRGLEPGQRVALALTPTPQAIALWHGVWRAGITPLLLHLRFAPHEHARVLQAVRPVAVLTTPEAQPRLRLPAEVATWALPPTPLRPTAPVPPAPGPREALLLTSGTTQGPKIARLTAANFFWSALASGYRLGVLPTDRWLLTLPLYHVGGLSVVLRSALYGTAIALPAPRPSFDPAGLWEDLARLRATLVSLVPTMLYRLLRATEGRALPGHVRVLLVGGAAAGPQVLAWARERGWPVALTYGLTEAASQVATARPDLVQRKPGTVGRPLLGLKVQVRGPAGAVLPPGQVGEIWVHGPQVFASYWGHPQATARALTPEGWLRTGDAGYVDEEGHLWVLARREDLIVTGGENVAPQEVEDVLRAHPAVADAAVVGLPDAEWGQVVAAAVVLKPGQRVTVEALQQHCRARLAGYKVPRRVAFVAGLPRTASGKVRRAALRAAWPIPPGEDA